MEKRPTVGGAAVVALVLALMIVPAALAAKGGKPAGGGSTASVNLVVLGSTDGQPHWGQQVTFTVSTTATDRPFVGLQCYQGGARVYSMSAGFFADYPFTKTYTLSSSYWTSGAADCTATLYYFTSNGRERTLKTMSFRVYA